MIAIAEAIGIWLADFGLLAESAAVDTAGEPPALPFDFLGNKRPLGKGPDFGAIERAAK